MKPSSRHDSDYLSHRLTTKEIAPLRVPAAVRRMKRLLLRRHYPVRAAYFSLFPTDK